MTIASGKKITDAINDIRFFYSDIALLLKTSDSYLIEKKGFVPFSGSDAISGGSYSINLPDQWIPSTIYRCYKHSDYDQVVAFISIILFNRDFEEWSTQSNHLREPVISAGWAKFKDEINPSCRAWLPKMFLWSLINPDGKTEHTRTDFTNAPKTTDRIIERCMALPLVEVQNTEHLLTKILNPFCDELMKQGK